MNNNNDVEKPDPKNAKESSDWSEKEIDEFLKISDEFEDPDMLRKSMEESPKLTDRIKKEREGTNGKVKQVLDEGDCVKPNRETVKKRIFGTNPNLNYDSYRNFERLPDMPLIPSLIVLHGLVRKKFQALVGASYSYMKLLGRIENFQLNGELKKFLELRKKFIKASKKVNKLQKKVLLRKKTWCEAVKKRNSAESEFLLQWTKTRKALVKKLKLGENREAEDAIYAILKIAYIDKQNDSENVLSQIEKGIEALLSMRESRIKEGITELRDLYKKFQEKIEYLSLRFQVDVDLSEYGLATPEEVEGWPDKSEMFRTSFWG